MAIEVLVFDRLSNVIGEIYPDVTEVTWRLNQYGVAKYQLPVSDSKATEDFFRFGNRVLFRFSNGLPDFGGVVDVPRTWEGGLIKATAYSGEYLLTFRQTDKGRYFSRNPVGTIAEQLIIEANAKRPTGLTVGDIWRGGDLHSPEYHYKNLYNIFTQSLFGRLSTAHFDALPSYANGRISFNVNVYERRGASKPGVALHSGFNVARDTSLSEQGPIYNEVVTVGDGTGWGDDRLTASQNDSNSLSEFGLREYTIMMTGTALTTTLQAGADTAITNNAQPHNIFTIAATNDTPGTFAQYDLGDSPTAELVDYTFGGFRGDVQILGRTYYPHSGTCDLVVREV